MRQTLTTEQAAAAAAFLLDEKKANDIVLLDVRGLCNFTDFFIIASMTTGTQIRALAGLLREAMKASGRAVHHDPMMTTTSWLIVDAGDVVTHLFLPEARDYYSLERLWGDATILDPSTMPEADDARAFTQALLASSGSIAEVDVEEELPAYRQFSELGDDDDPLNVVTIAGDATDVDDTDGDGDREPRR